MAKSDKLAEKFNLARKHIEDVATEVLELYPNSTRVDELKTEFSAAIEGLKSLGQTLNDVVTVQETEKDLSESIMNQIEGSELYMAAFTPNERKELAGYLAEHKESLADQDLLIAYVAKSLEQKSVSDLIAMYPKTKITEIGEKLDDGSDDFNAYQAGYDQIREDFDNDKHAAVDELSKLWLDKGLEAVVKEYYAKVFKPEEEMSEDDA